MLQTLPKSERLCGGVAIKRLLAGGRFGYEGPLKFCWLPRTDQTEDAAPGNRLMVSVSKKLYKRAVKRNRLKRLLREAYRLQKGTDLMPCGVDLLLVYNSKEMASFEQVSAAVKTVLQRISHKMGAPEEKV